MARKKIALITGYCGFVGGYLAGYLYEQGCRVYGTYFAASPPASEQHRACSRFVTGVECDMTKRSDVRRMLQQVRPDFVYHLAAQSHVPTAWKRPAATFKVNVIGTLNLLQTIHELGLQPRILSVCSADEYGDVRADELPLAETAPLRPMNPYATSKVAQDFLSQQYAKAPGLDVVRVRPFNHTGPGQNTAFVCSRLAWQVARIELGMQEPVLTVGNLKPRRDFLDVRDVMRAYHLALQKGRQGEVYNIASGKARSIQSILDMLVSYGGRDVRIERDDSLYRPADVMEVRGNATRLRRSTGWRPLISFETTLHDILDYWLRVLKKQR